MDKITNLYLCGAGVHPGGGLPGVVTSAKVVERLVQNALSIGGRDNSKALNPSKTEAAA
jgi:phytoene desaturase